MVIVDEDYPRCSIAGDISALVAEEAFDYLDAPPKRVMAPHVSVPYSLPLEMAWMPSKERVVEAALAHKTPDAVQAAYRRTTYLGTPDNPGARVKLMEAWGNYCSGNAVPHDSAISVSD